MFEHHGDYQCTGVPDGTPQVPDDGEDEDPSAPRPMTSAGLDCLTESVPDGYGKLITQPLGLEGDINDVRAPNSTVLEWYYQLAARWVPKLECSDYPGAQDDDDTAEAESLNGKVAAAATAATEATESTAKATGKKGKKKKKVHSALFPRPKAMSFHNFAGPGDLNLKQSSFVFTYQVGWNNVHVLVHDLFSISCGMFLWSRMHWGCFVYYEHVSRSYPTSARWCHSLPRTWSPSSGIPAACTTAALCCA